MKNKYNNKHCYIGDIQFHSLLERDCYLWVKAFLKRYDLLDAIMIKTQFRIPIIKTKNSRSSYVADIYLYQKDEDPELHTGLILDAKGFRTVAFKQKKIMVKSIIGLDIHEVKNASNIKDCLDKWLDQKNIKPIGDTSEKHIT
ncbi:MAG: hypothetical protein ACRCXT_00495 [Paraclostridium sp.]